MRETRARLVQATIEEIESVGLGATTKQIAKRAKVNELTLFRNFKTKQQLVIAAVSQSLGPVFGTSSSPTGAVETDLAALATHYVGLADTHPGLITYILGEANEELVVSLVLPIQEQIARNASELLGFYVQQGDLPAKIPIEDLIREFMGPLMARAFLHRTLELASFDAPDYVHRFLHGHRA
jgi:AcrR family transcriptional regulator